MAIAEFGGIKSGFKWVEIGTCIFNLILYLFHEDYIQPEATSSSPHAYLIVVRELGNKTRPICISFQAMQIYRTTCTSYNKNENNYIHCILLTCVDSQTT